MKNTAVFFLSNSYGEMNNILYLILNEKNLKKIHLIVNSHSLYESIVNDEIATKIIKDKNVNLVVKKRNKLSVIYYLLKSNVIYHSDDLYIKQNIKITILSKIFNKKKIIFKHTTSPYFRDANIKPRNHDRDKNYEIIVFYKSDYDYFSKLKYKKVTLKKDFYKNKQMISYIKSSKFNLKFKKYVLIMSFRVHEILSYNDKLSSFKDIFLTLIKKTKIKTVIIKPHPSEKIDEIKIILKKIKINNFNIYILNNNSLLLSYYARLTISFGYGALTSFYFGNISIIYNKYINKFLNYHKIFNFFEPIKTGIPIIETKKELINFIKKINRNNKL
jgi:hypothetical protein